MTRTTRTSRTVTLAALLALGCSSEPPVDPNALTAATDTVNGVPRVRISGEAPAWTAEPVLRLGAMDGGPQEFGRIRSLTADAAGNVYVADNASSEIRVFDPEGRHLRTIGRRGQGPGEFGDLYSLAWLGDDLVAMDPRNARIGVLGPDGGWIRGMQHYAITGPASLIRLHPLANDGFYTPAVDPQSGRLPFVHMTAAGPTDTIFPPGAPADARPTGTVCRRTDGGIVGISVPEAPAAVYAFPPVGGLIATAWTERYEVAFLDRVGDTLRVVAREVSLPPYPDTLWAQGEGPLRELHRDYPGSACEPAELTRPGSRAAFRHILFDDQGRMWVEAAAADGFVWEVFDENGRLLGRAPAPARSPRIPPYARGDRLYQVETDALGVEHVAVYRLAPTG